jgi:hypothetical protein
MEGIGAGEGKRRGSPCISLKSCKINVLCFEVGTASGTHVSDIDQVENGQAMKNKDHHLQLRGQRYSIRYDIPTDLIDCFPGVTDRTVREALVH